MPQPCKICEEDFEIINSREGATDDEIAYCPYCGCVKDDDDLDDLEE